MTMTVKELADILRILPDNMSIIVEHKEYSKLRWDVTGVGIQNGLIVLQID